MDDKQKRMALIFAMAFVATTMVMVMFGEEGIEGRAIGFESLKEKSEACESFCDTDTKNENTPYKSWTHCHEECTKES